MLIHRLEQLEALTKEQHASFEDLRVDFVTHKTTINTRVALIGTLFSVVVTIANVLINFI
jgi:hypothetical protein